MTSQSNRVPSHRRNTRSKEGRQWQAYYSTKIWKAIRAQQLASHPLCAMCEKTGRLTAATVCDHIIPHRGGWSLFVSGPFASLCKQCHDTHAQRRDRTGQETKVIGIDGWPVED